jgi:protein-S-isoprenylcysteine O-methyltransferase Ste14
MKTHQGLLLYFVGYFAAAFAWRSWANWRATGINPVVLPKSDDAYGYVARGFKLTMMALLAYLVTGNLWPKIVALNVGSLPFLDAAWIRNAGWVLLLVALLTTIKAQSDMGSSWRIGIDTKRRTALVTHGVYARSRNPIFLSMRLAMLGLVLVDPNALSLALLLSAEVLMQVQVRLEESHLEQLHKTTYIDYRQRVRRWL